MLKLIDGKLYREETGYFEVLHADPRDHAKLAPLYIVVDGRLFMQSDVDARKLSGQIVSIAYSDQKVRNYYQYIATKGQNYQLNQIFIVGTTYTVESYLYTAEDHRHIYNSTPKAYPEYFITPSGDMLYNGALYQRI